MRRCSAERAHGDSLCLAHAATMPLTNCSQDSEKQGEWQPLGTMTLPHPRDEEGDGGCSQEQALQDCPWDS